MRGNPLLNVLNCCCLGQLTIREAELAAVTEERDNARRDLSETHLAKDEIVKKAWELRDQAVQRKNKAEIEVARTRIDMMQVNSQLMEAIQQKIQLSQQLEQWQVCDQISCINAARHDIQCFFKLCESTPFFCLNSRKISFRVFLCSRLTCSNSWMSK